MRPVPDPVRHGQESVWDYPRPPRVEPVDARVTIDLGGERIVDTRDVVRVLETSHPPVYYLPITAFVEGALTRATGSSFCEFKGAARYLSVHGGGRTAARAAWNYPSPSPGFELLRDGRVHGRRRTRHAAARFVLRRLDHREPRRPVQGVARQHGVVTGRADAAAGRPA
jgi:uncharacterized protein (DUF427 family)